MEGGGGILKASEQMHEWTARNKDSKTNEPTTKKELEKEPEEKIMPVKMESTATTIEIV